jgi:uncharacterized Zn finger protein
MSEARRLLNEHYIRLHELQSNCPHTELSDWLETRPMILGEERSCWIKTCERCGKIVQETISPPDDVVEKLKVSAQEVSGSSRINTPSKEATRRDE